MSRFIGGHDWAEALRACFLANLYDGYADKAVLEWCKLRGVMCRMEVVSRQVVYQRIRNRIIEVVEIHSSFEDVAFFGAFEAIEMVHDNLPLDYCEAPNVFSENEKEAISEFFRLVNHASDATRSDTWDIAFFNSAEEWVRLRDFSGTALVVFEKRGRFSEETEEDLGS